jgi:hypothetical protein
MTYATYCSYIDRLGKDTGFEDKLTTYCFRQGTANAIDGMYLRIKYPNTRAGFLGLYSAPK